MHRWSCTVNREAPYSNQGHLGHHSNQGHIGHHSNQGHTGHHSNQFCEEKIGQEKAIRNEGSRGPIRQKWNSPRACGPRPVPMVAPGGHFFSNSGLAEHINSKFTGYARYAQIANNCEEPSLIWRCNFASTTI